MAVINGKEAEVVVLDLRGRDPSDPPPQPDVDTGRLVIVDRAEALVERQSFYEGMLGRRAVRAMLLVVVGSPRAENGRTTLTLSPAMVATEAVATLWVGDTGGIEWDMEHGQAIGGGGPAAGGSELGLELLLDVLRLHEVFDGVVAETCAMPNRVAAPGLYVTPGRFGDDVLAEALRKGLDRLVGGLGDRSGYEAGADELVVNDRSRNKVLTLLLNERDAIGVPGVSEPLVPGRPLYQLRAACDDTGRSVAGLRSELESVTALLSADRPGPRAFARLTAAGTALKDFRDRAEQLFTEADGYEGMDQVVHDRLVRAGVRMEPGGAVAEDPGDALRLTIQGELDRGVSLRTLAARLRDYAARVAPGGSGEERRLLRQLCPDWMLQGLARPYAFVLQPYRAGLLVASLIFGLVLGLTVGSATDPGLGPVVRLVGLALLAGLAWAAGVALLHARIPQPAEHGGEHGWGAVSAKPPLAHGGLLFAGMFAGHLFWRIPLTDSWAEPPGSLVGLAVLAVLGGMALVLVGWWRSAVARWCATLPIPAAQSAGTGLAEHVRRVVVREWVLADHRRAAADTALTYAAVLEDLIDALYSGVTQYRDALLARDEFPGPRRGGARLGEYGVELADLVADDLVDLAAHVLAPLWQQVYGGAPSDVNVRIGQSTGRALGGYWDHLRRRGVHERPAFSRDNPRRGKLAEAVWRQSGDIADVVRMPVGSGMVQLCGRADLAVLRGTAGSRAVRFAPRAAHPPLAGARLKDQAWAPPADMVWTSAGQLAGVVRLVPLRTGIVDSGWAVA